MKTLFYGDRDCDESEGKTSNVRRWIRNIREEIGDDASPSRWMIAMDMRLRGEAARWATRADIKAMLEDDAVDSATETDVKRFQELLSEEFPEPNQEDITEQAENDIRTLKQGEDTFHDYYKRTTRIMHNLGGKDVGPSRPESSLDRVSKYLLRDVINRFKSGLKDMELRKRLVEDVTDELSLQKTYLRVERVYEAMKKKQAMEDEEVSRRTNEKAMSFMEQLSQTNGDLYEAALGVNLTYVDNSGVTQRPWRAPVRAPRYTNIKPEDRFQDVTSTYSAATQQQPPVAAAQQQRQLPSKPFIQQPIKNETNKASGTQPGAQATFQTSYTSQDARRYPTNTYSRKPFDPARSTNPYINGSKNFDMTTHFICYRCCQVYPWEETTHRDSCTGMGASFEEKKFVRERDQALRAQKREDRNPSFSLPPMQNSFRPGQRQPPAQGVGSNAVSLAPLDDEEGRVIGELHETESSDSLNCQSTTVKKGHPPDEDLSCETGVISNAAAKRRRAAEEDESDEAIEIVRDRERAKAKPKSKGKTTRRKGLRMITGILGEQPPDVRQILLSTNVVLSTMHLMQLSPHFRKETSRLMRNVQDPIRPRRKKAAQVEEIPTQGTDETIRNSRTSLKTNSASLATPRRDLHAVLDKEKVAYSMTAVVICPHAKTYKTLGPDRAKADQGSDIITINPSLVRELQMKERPLQQLGVNHLTMSVANGDFTPLRTWVMFNIRVAGISRDVWAFVTPKDNPNHDVLLGLPWLKSVTADFKIQSETLRIGDTSKGEEVRILRPQMKASSTAV